VSTSHRPLAQAHLTGTAQAGLAEARYVLPSFIERTSYGIKEMNPYNKLFEERIIFLGVQIDDASANDVIAQLIALESMDPDRDITMYINSPGGSVTSMMAIYDTMQFVQPEIQTVCIGQAASAAAVLLAAGSKDKRMALPNARILLHQPATEGGYGQFDGAHHRQAQRQGRGAGPPRCRAGQVLLGRRGQGVWPRGRRSHEPEAPRRGRVGLGSTGVCPAESLLRSPRRV